VRIKRLRARYLYTLVIVTALLLVAGAVSFERSVFQLLNQMHRASATHNEIMLLDGVLGDVKDVERGSDGFVITRDQEFLRAYDSGTRSLAADSSALARSLARQPDRSAEFARAEQSADRFLTLSRRIVGLADSAPPQATALIASHAQIDLVDQIASIIGDLSRQEREELSAEQQAVRMEARQAALTGAWALALTIALLAFVVLAMRREIVRRTTARNATAQVNEQLAERVNELHQRSMEITLLSEMSEMLQISGSIDEMRHVLPEFGARLFPHFGGVVFTVRSSPDAVEAAAWWGEAPEVTTFGLSDCWALRLGRPHLVEKDSAGLRCRHSRADGAQATLCVPMQAQGEAIGVLYLVADPDTLIQLDVEKLAKSVADQMSLGIANLRLQETLRTRAMHDPLTGLFNRRHMEESLENELRAAQRQSTSIAVMMIDVDHFKRYNDTYGHAGGDALLEQLSQLMMELFRDRDIICRYGGEEFLAIMPGADLATVSARAEQLRLAAKTLQVRAAGKPLGPVTISVGIAVYPDHASTSESLLATADSALYEAKHRGRDCVVAGPQMQRLIAV
jgi:diguanylate cyclase (GGDEF)-like protein